MWGQSVQERCTSVCQVGDKRRGLLLKDEPCVWELWRIWSDGSHCMRNKGKWLPQAIMRYKMKCSIQMKGKTPAIASLALPHPTSIISLWSSHCCFLWLPETVECFLWYSSRSCGDMCIYIGYRCIYIYIYRLNTQRILEVFDQLVYGNGPGYLRTDELIYIEFLKTNSGLSRQAERIMMVHKL